MSALLAPIMMLIQSGSVVQILSGRDTGWNPQRRDDGSIPFGSIVRRHRTHMALGVLTLFAGLLISHLARRLDVADDRRPYPGDPPVLGERTIVDRRRAAAPRPSDDARGDFAARHRPALERAVHRTRAEPAMTATMACAPFTAIRRFARSTNFSCPRRRDGGAAKSMSRRRWRRPSSTTQNRSKKSSPG